MSRIHEQFLDRQQRLAEQSIARATRKVGAEVETLVDVRGFVRRRPALALGAGVVGGFVTGTMLRSGSRGLVRTAYRYVAVPLFRPTLSALASTLAGILVGAPPRS